MATSERRKHRFFDLLQEYLTWLEASRGRTAVTVDRYGASLEQLADYMLERGTDPLAISTRELEAFTGLHLHEKGLQAVSRRPVVAAVRGFYRWAKERGHLAVDPAGMLEYPKAGRRLPIPITLENAQRLMMAPDLSTLLGARDAAIMAVLFGCGLRLSGLTALDEEDLQLTEVEGRERMIIKVREKGKNERTVPAPLETQLMVQAYLGHRDLLEIDRTLPSGRRVLFVSTNNRMVPEDKYHGEERRMKGLSINRVLHKYGQQCGIPPEQLNPHAGRHLFGTELAEADVDLITRQSLLGHADPRTTEIYTHLAMRKRAQVIDDASPIRKIMTPVTEIAQELEK